MFKICTNAAAVTLYTLWMTEGSNTVRAQGSPRLGATRTSSGGQLYDREEWAGVQRGQRGVEATLIMLSGENKMCVLFQVCPRYVKTHALPSTSCNKQNVFQDCFTPLKCFLLLCLQLIQNRKQDGYEVPVKVNIKSRRPICVETE